MLNLHWFDLATLGFYFVALGAMGYYFSRRVKDTEQYFVAGRSYPGWVVGLSLVGTSMSTVTFLALPADSFKTTWIRYIPNMMLPLGVLIAAYLFLPFFRRGRITSAYEYLENRYGPSIRVYATLVFILAQLIRVSIILYLVSLVVHEVTGFSPVISILIGGVFVALYTVFGGIEAVIWTDVLQTIILVLGGVLCLAYIVNALPGGFGQLIEVAHNAEKFSFKELENGELVSIGWGITLSQKTITMLMLFGLVNWLRAYCADQNVIQRYVTSRTAKEARKAMAWCAISSVLIWGFYKFLGTGLFAYFDVFPDANVTPMLTGEAKAEQILPYFIINFLPIGITGIVIAAAMAAAMSTLDSNINAIATVGIVDLYRRHIKKDKSDRHYLIVARTIATAAGAIMILGAILLIKVDTRTLQDTGLIMSSILSGGILGLYMFGFFTNLGDARAVWVGLACTLLFTTWTVIPSDWLPDFLHVPFDLYYVRIVGNLVFFVVGFLASLLIPRRGSSLTNLTIWHQDGTPLD